MALIDQFDQPAAIDMRIDLRGRDVGMTKHRLQRTQIRAACQQMRGKGMAQDMRTDFAGINARFRRQCLDDLEQPNAADMGLAATEKDSANLVGTKACQSSDRLPCAVGNWHQPFLVTLARQNDIRPVGND